MKTKKRFKTSLALLLSLVMLFSVMSPMMSFTATALTVDLENVGANTKLTSKTDYAVAPGITESHIITHNKDGSNQVQAYALEIDLSNPNVGLIAGYKNYMNDLSAAPEWGMQTVRDQAVAAENYYKTKGEAHFEVVGGMNCDFFNMQSGAPLGSLVMNGVKYNETKKGGNSSYFAILDDGTAVIGSGEIPANAKEVVGGSNMLVTNGVINPNIKSNPDVFPRSSIGITADGKVILVTADGRQAPSSCGQTLAENAQQMLSLGCVTAMQVDGGGSATLVSQREGETALSVRNSPSDGVERIVSSSLLVYSNAVPDGEFHHANLAPVNNLYTPGSTVEFTATGVDGSGAAAELPAEGYFALADAAAGTIDPATGVFTAAADFTGEVVVNYMVSETIKGSTSVNIVIPDELYVASKEQAVGPGVTTDFGIVAKYEDRDVIMKAGDIEWSIAPQNTSETEDNTCYVLIRAENLETYSNKKLFGKYPKTSEYKSDYYVKTPTVISQDDDYAIIKYVARSPSYPDCDIDSIIRNNIVGDANILAYGYVPETLFFDAGFAGSFNGLTFTGAEENAYNAKITAKLNCNEELAPLELTVFIGSKQVTLHDFEYVTGEENKDAPNYISTFDLPTYSATYLTADETTGRPANAGYASRTDLAKALYEQDIPLYMWPNAAVSDATNSSATATVVSAADGEPVRFGDHALRIEFDFSEFNKASNANFYLRETTPPYRYEGSPTAMGVWVYAPEGTTAYHLYLQCAGNIDVEANGGVTSYQQLTSPEAMGTDKQGISWEGWRYLEFDLTGTKGHSGVMNVGGAYEPYGQKTDNGIFWISYQPSNMGTDVTSDTIYIDDITLIYGANTSDTHNPEINYIGDMNEQIVDGETVYTSNTNTFKAQYADFEDKYMTGINDEATKMYIDGVDVTGKCYIDAGNDEIYYYNAVLPDGVHVIEIEVADVFGNKTTEMRYFTIDSGAEDTEVAFEAANVPVLGEDFILDIVTNNAADIASADIEIKVLSFFTSYWRDVEVVPAPGFKLDGEAVYNSIRDTLSFRLVRDDVATFALRSDKLASIITRVPADTPENLEVTHRISKGAITYLSGETDTVTAFSGKVVSVCEAPLTISTDTMLVGSAGGNIYVTDKDGNAVEGAEVYSGDVLLGTTDAEGKLFTDAFVSAVTEFSLTASKTVEVTPADPENGVEAVYNVLRSFAFKSQSYESKGDTTGLPTYVKLNAAKTAWDSQSVSWMANPLYTADKAVVLYAEKAAYDADPENAVFTEFTGVSYLSELNASKGGAATNYAIRFNSAELTGLKENTEYVFKVGDGTNWSAIKTFRTAKANTATNFFVFADIQTTTGIEIGHVNNALGNSGIDFDFGISTGDIVDNAGEYDYWEAAGAALTSGVLGSTDIFHALGNHEYQGDYYGANATNYFDLPGLNNTAPEAFSAEYGNIYIASMGFLNNMTLYKSALEWIKEDAAQSDATWKLLVVHQPPYYTNPGGATKGYRELVTEAADEIGLDFVFSGHDHSYARTQPITAGIPDAENGTVYFVSGSIGGKGYDFTDEPAHYYAAHMDYKDYSSVYMTVKVTDTEFTVEAYASTPAAPDVFTMIDAYTATKTVDCTTDGHSWTVDNGWLVCSVCSYTKEFDGYTGLINDKTTGRLMSIIDGVPETSKWLEVNEAIYYLGEDGVAVAGENNQIGDYTYDFDENGKLTGYAILEDGALVSSKWIEYNGGIAYLDESGVAATGERKIGDYTYNFDAEGKLLGYAIVKDGALVSSRWIDYDGGVAYLDESGIAATGERKIGEYTYVFDENAKLTKLAFVNSDEGTLVTNIWITNPVSNKLNYLGDDGLPVTGAHKIYCDTTDGKTNLTYTFDENGDLEKGAFSKSGKYTYYYIAGIKQRNWFEIDGYWYYFDRQTGFGMATLENDGNINNVDSVKDGKYPVASSDGTTLLFTFDNQGRLVKGALAQTDLGLVYYWADNERLTGWHYIEGDIYYFGDDYYAATGETVIDEVTYSFSAEGKLQLVEESFELDGVFYYYDANGAIVKNHILDHAYDKAVIEPSAPDCDTTGLTAGEKCASCGFVLIAQEVVPENGHDYEAVVTPPTCTENGYTTHTCSVCDDFYTDTEVKKLGHTEGEWTVVKEAEIGKAGLEQKACTVCNEVLDSREIDALEEPTSEEPTTEEPTTEEPTTEAPTTEAPTTEAPTTEPTTEPTTVPTTEIESEIESETVPVVYYKLGDTDRDGKVTAADARIALRYAAKIDVPATAKDFIVADVNVDNKITALDARKILRVAAGLDKEF